jgi:flagellar hook protein FlgE
VTSSRDSLFAFKKRAAELGAIQEYEADSGGRVYAVYENGEVLPIGVTLTALAGRSKLTPDQFNGAVQEAMRGA